MFPLIFSGTARRKIPCAVFMNFGETLAGNVRSTFFCIVRDFKKTNKYICLYSNRMKRKLFLTLKWSYGVFRHPRGRKIAIIPKLLQIKIWNFLTFIIWLSSKNWCHYYFVGCHLWRHHGHQRGTGRRRNYNFLTVHSIKQDIHFFTFVKMCVLNPIYVFEVGEFNGDTFRTIPPPVYLENPVRTGSSGTSRLPIFLPCGIL